MIAVGPIRWRFSGMENHLCAGSACNRSSDEIIHEVPTNTFCWGRRVDCSTRRLTETARSPLSSTATGRTRSLNAAVEPFEVDSGSW